MSPAFNCRTDKNPSRFLEGRDCEPTLGLNKASARTYGPHDLVDAQPAAHEAQAFDAEHPLFILYTSGTTGKPKGILHTTGGYLLPRSPTRTATCSTSSPKGVSFPLIKPRSIDDVPILALTFHGEEVDHFTLRRIVAEVDDAVKQVPLVAETTIVGGERRQLRVLLDPAKLTSRQLSADGVVQSKECGKPQLERSDIWITWGRSNSDCERPGCREESF